MVWEPTPSSTSSATTPPPQQPSTPLHREGCVSSPDSAAVRFLPAPRLVPAGGAGRGGAWLRSSYGGTRTDLEACVRLAQEGRITIEVETFPLADALDAFRELERGNVRGRAVLVP